MTGDEALGYGFQPAIGAMDSPRVSWPPAYAYDNFVAAPAGEIPRRPLRPTAGQLDYAHKALQVVFMGLALVGVLVLLGTDGPRAVVRGAARKHAVQTGPGQ